MGTLTSNLIDFVYGKIEQLWNFISCNTTEIVFIYLFISIFSFLLIRIRPKGKNVHKDIFNYVTNLREFPWSIFYAFALLILLPFTIHTTIIMFIQERKDKQDEEN